MLIRDLLVKNKVQELKETAKIIGLTGYSKLKKDELIASIEEAIMNEEYAKKVFFLANDKELELFERKLTSSVPVLDEEIGNYVYLCKSLFYFLVGENEFVVPEGLKEIYEAVQTEEFKEKRARFHLVNDYFTALANLYGMVSMEQVIKVFNEQNEESTTEKEIHKVYGIMKDVKGSFVELVENTFVHEAVLEEAEGLAILTEKQADKPYYVPNKEILLCYADEMFFEKNAAYHALVAYLTEKVVKDEYLANDLATEIQYRYSFGEELSTAIELLEECEIEMDEDVLKGLIDCLVDLYNHTRFWENRGFSPTEMKDMGEEEPKVEIQEEKKEEPKEPVIPKFAPTVYPTYMPTEPMVVRKKIGRNDPCPCGSGQKFKRCCGK